MVLSDCPGCLDTGLEILEPPLWALPSLPHGCQLQSVVLKVGGWVFQHGRVHVLAGCFLFCGRVCMCYKKGPVGTPDFIFLVCKIIADSVCSHEIKRRLLLGRKAMTNLDSLLKSRDITLLTKVHIVKAMVFPVGMYGCESWTIKKAERQRIDTFGLWY